MADTIGKSLHYQSKVTDAERATLSFLSYPAVHGVSDVTQQIEQTGKWKVIKKQDGSDSGLEIYAVQKVGTDELVFVIRGSDTEPDGWKDWGPMGANAAFAGRFHEQHEEAIKFVNKFINKHRDHNGKDEFHYSLAGHSKGGGFAQILSHIFGLVGTGIDSAPASRVIGEDNDALKDFLDKEHIEIKGMPEHGFVNYIEKGSAVGESLVNLDIPFFELGSHLGDTVKVDLVPGSWRSSDVKIVEQIKEQHNAFDDAAYLASKGMLYILQQRLEEYPQEIAELERDRAEAVARLEEHNNAYKSGDDQGFIEDDQGVADGYAADIKKLDQQLATAKKEQQDLQELFLQKVEEEYGEPAEVVLQRGKLEPRPDIPVFNELIAAKEMFKEDLLQQLANLQEQKEHFISSMGDGDGDGDGWSRGALKQQTQREYERAQLEHKISDVEKKITDTELNIELLKVDRDILVSQESWNKTEADLADDGWLDLSNFLQNGGASSDEDFNIFDDFDFGSDLHLNGNENDNTDWESKLDNSTNPFAGSIFPDGFNFGSNLHLNDSSDNGYSGIDWDSAGSGFLDNILSGHINKDGYWINPDGTQSILLADTGDGMQFLPGSFFGQSAGESAAETAEDKQTAAVTSDLNEHHTSLSDPADSFQHGTYDQGEGTFEHLSDSGWNIRLDNSKDPFDLSNFTGDYDFGSGLHLNDSGELSIKQPAAEPPASSSRELEHNLAAANSIKEYYNSIYNLSEAFEHGTVFDKGGSVLEHLSANVEAGRYFNEGSGGSSSASDSFSSTAGANLDAAASAFGLAGAIDSGDGLAIAHSGLKLVSSIDRALDIEAKFDDKLQTTSDTAGLSDDAAQGLGIAMSGLDLAMALDDGDGLAIAASGVSLAKNISGASAGSGLGVLGSGLSLAQDIDGLDDAFSSGDAKTIAQATMNTAYDAVSLYNSASAMAGFSQVGASNLPAIGAAIGVAQGVMRAFDGDVAGGAVDAGVAVASCYLMTIPVWGWAAAAVLTIANALLNTSEPPKGHADFSIENGVVDFAVSGDSEMEGQTSGMAEVIRGSMQSYINGGGRVALEGERMPTLSTEAGATPHLDYGSTGGGNIRVNLDPNDPGGSLLSVLVARDRGADLSMAVRQSQLPGGGIDIAHMDAILAGLGYVKDGINYVYGERREVNLSTVGTGVFAGGHNVDGPEGEVIVARQSDITVHPLRENQLPQRTIGKVIENIDVGSNLLGAGSSLFAAALMGVGLGRNQASAAESPPSAASAKEFLPLDAATAAAYRRGDWSPADDFIMKLQQQAA